MNTLWQTEITPDANLYSSLGPIAIDKTNKLLIPSLSSFSSRSKVSSEAKLWLFEVDPNSGTVDRKSFIQNIAGRKIGIGMAPLVIKALMVSENNDEVLVGDFNSYNPSILMINRTKNINKSIELVSKSKANENNRRGLHINGGVALSEGNLLLIGQRSDNGVGGLVIKVDSEGNHLWDKSYKIIQGQTESFYDVAVCNNSEFAIVGNSANISKLSALTADNFILLCNAQGELIAKDLFNANPFPGPQICKINSGNLVVIYGKTGEGSVNMRGYSPTLKLLWEKSVVKSEQNKPSSFKIVPTSRNSFIIAANVDFGNLKVFEYDENGNQLAKFSMNKEIGLGNIGLVSINNKVLVAFETPPNFKNDVALSRIKIKALEIK